MLEKKYIIVLVIVGIIILGTSSYFIIKAITKNPPSPNPPPPTPSQCSSSNCANCKTKDSCTNAGCTFDGNKCSSPSPPPPPPPCSSTNCDSCKTEVNCNAQSDCTFDGTCVPKCSSFNSEQDCNGQDRCIYNKNVCQDKKSCAYPCTPNGKCNFITGSCECNDRYEGDSCQIFYPPSLPTDVCFVPGKGGHGNYKTKHNSATGSMYSTFVITCPIFSYSEGIYKRDKNCGDGAEYYKCITYCNTLSSSSLKWSKTTGSCGNYDQCSVPDSYNAALIYSTIQDMDNAKPDKTQQTSNLGVRFLFPPSDPDNPPPPPPDVQWLLNDYVQIQEEDKNPVDYYQIISNSTVNQLCELQNKYTSSDDTFYNNGNSYGQLLGTGTQSTNVCIGISATNLQNVKTDSIQNKSIKTAQLIPLITNDFMEPQLLPGDFNQGTTWVNLGSCKTTKTIKQGMTIYVRIKNPKSESDSYFRLYLYSQSSQLKVNSASWLGYCTCFGDVSHGKPCNCGYENNQIIPADSRDNNNSMSAMLYWVVWPDEDIENCVPDFNSEESYTLGGKANEYKNPPYNLAMPALGDFFLWNIYGVGVFPQMIPNNPTQPVGFNTPDGGGAPSCNLPACPQDISKLYFMDEKGLGQDKSACHLLEAEPDKFNCITEDKSTYACQVQGVWGFDISNEGTCTNTGCGNVLSLKCGDDGTSNTIGDYLCDLTRNVPSYYKINKITPNKDNKWGGSGILKVSADKCLDPNTKPKDLFTMDETQGCVANTDPNPDPKNLYADPNCVYNCGTFGLKPKTICQYGTFYCQGGQGCKEADKGGTQADKCYTNDNCNGECRGPPPPPPAPPSPTPPSPTPPSPTPPSPIDYCVKQCGVGSYCKGNGTCQNCPNIKCP